MHIPRHPFSPSHSGNEKERSLLNIGLLILFSIGLTSCVSTKSTFLGIDQTLKTSPVFETGFSGLAVYDPVKEKMLYAYNSGKHFTPASNTKLLTFYTGLKILGDSVPGIQYTIRNDSLIFSGTGDPSLLHPDLPHSSILSFLRKSDQDLYFLPPSVDEKVFGPGWAWDDYNYYYSVERSAFPVYANQVIFSPQHADLPMAYPEVFHDSLVLGDFQGYRILRTPYNNTYHYPIDFNSRNNHQVIPFKTAPATAVRLLEDTLNRNIEILYGDTEIDPDRVRYSIPTDSIYKRMLQVSDNFLAEQVLLMAAYTLSDTLMTQIAIDYMEDHYLKDLPDSMRWVDGSGLSRYNLTTPENMVQILEKIRKEVSYDRLFELLPAGGKTGTLRNQFHAKEAFIFAKTGSLSNNYSLSGYLITDKDRVLLFSFMNSNFTVPSEVLKAEMEKILRIIRDRY